MGSYADQCELAPLVPRHIIFAPSAKLQRPTPILALETLQAILIDLGLALLPKSAERVALDANALDATFCALAPNCGAFWTGVANIYNGELLSH